MGRIKKILNKANTQVKISDDMKSGLTDTLRITLRVIPDAERQRLRVDSYKYILP